MTDRALDSNTIDDTAADEHEATAPVIRAPLRARRPAEVTTFLAGVLILAAAFGLNLSEEQLLAGIAVVTGLPSVVTWIVGVFRDALRDLGE
jgi:hypothetical protein